MQNLFIPVNEAHDYYLRFSDTNVKIAFPHIDYLKRSLSYSGALLWNSLPSTLRNVPYVNNFHTSPQLHLQFQQETVAKDDNNVSLGGMELWSDTDPGNGYVFNYI